MVRAVRTVDHGSLGKGSTSICYHPVTFKTIGLDFLGQASGSSKEGHMTAKASLVIVCLCVCAPAASAQVPTGTISGRVVDQDGLAVPGVTVTATSPNLQGGRTVVTSMYGDYSI